jgi:hypothetical protein
LSIGSKLPSKQETTLFSIDNGVPHFISVKVHVCLVGVVVVVVVVVAAATPSSSVIFGTKTNGSVGG